MSTVLQLTEDLIASVPDFDMPVRVNVVGDDADLHITDIVVNPSDGVVRIIVEDIGEVEEVAQPAPPVASTEEI